MRSNVSTKLQCRRWNALCLFVAQVKVSLLLPFCLAGAARHQGRLGAERDRNPEVLVPPCP